MKKKTKKESKYELLNTHDFNHGVHISKKELLEWRERLLKEMISDNKCKKSFIRSGDGMVIGLKYDDEYKDEIDIFEISGYISYNYIKTK